MIIYKVNISIYFYFILDAFDVLGIIDKFCDNNFRFIDKSIRKMGELGNFLWYSMHLSFDFLKEQQKMIALYIINRWQWDIACIRE